MRSAPGILLFFVVLGSLPGADTRAEAYRSAALAAAREKNWDLAIENYQHALLLEPGDPDTHYNLALTLKYKGAARQAVEEFKTSLQLRPKWAEARYGLGATYYDL